VVNSGYLVYKLSKLSHHANLGLLGVGCSDVSSMYSYLAQCVDGKTSAQLGISQAQLRISKAILRTSEAPLSALKTQLRISNL